MLLHLLPLPAALEPVLGRPALVQLPAPAPYWLPATLQPVLLFVLQGALAVPGPQGGWQWLAPALLEGPKSLFKVF